MYTYDDKASQISSLSFWDAFEGDLTSLDKEEESYFKSLVDVEYVVRPRLTIVWRC